MSLELTEVKVPELTQLQSYSVHVHTLLTPKPLLSHDSTLLFNMEQYKLLKSKPLGLHHFSIL